MRVGGSAACLLLAFTEAVDPQPGANLPRACSRVGVGSFEHPAACAASFTLDNALLAKGAGVSVSFASFGEASVITGMKLSRPHASHQVLK